MRKMFVAAAILAATSVHAAEELKFGDVNYFLKQGQVNLTADLDSAYEKYKDDRTDQSYETRGLITRTSLGYAITDRVNAYIGVNYAYDLETENKTTTSEKIYNSDGFSNPSLGLNARLLNQSEAPVNFDVGAVLRYGIEDAKRGFGGTDGKNGNFANGRDSLELNARVGRKWNEANEWQLAAGAIYNNDGEFERKSDGEDVDQESSLDYFARATYQYRPVNEFMMLVSLQANYVGEQEEEDSLATTTLDAHLEFDFRFTAKYLITDNFIAKFNYGMSRNPDIDGDVAGSDFEIRKRRENFMGLGVDFLF